jgi:hypothetical protein
MIVTWTAGLSGCAVSQTNTIPVSSTTDIPRGTPRYYGSNYVTIIDSSRIRSAIRQGRSAHSANLTRGQKAAVLGGGILLILLALEAMDATDDLSEHIDTPTPP